MYRAHEESALKSKRLGAAWKVKKEEAARPDGEKITSRGPAWLSLIAIRSMSRYSESISK
jgi:hypothetical protein